MLPHSVPEHLFDHALHDATGNIFTHRIVDTTSVQDQSRMETVILCLTDQVVRIDSNAMSSDQTGLERQEIPFRPAAASTSFVSIPIRWKIFDNSFIKAMLMSRWEFSITLAASATLILETG